MTATRSRSRRRPGRPRGLPLIAPEDFRRLAIDVMTAEGGDPAAATERYATLLAAAPDVLSRRLMELHESFPAMTFDWSEASLLQLGRRAARRSARTPPDDPIVDGMGAYLGEALRIVTRGKWWVRFDPTASIGYRASTLHFDPGIPDHPGFESEVFRVAEACASGAGGASILHDHFRFARRLMESPLSTPVEWNGSGCRPAPRRRRTPYPDTAPR